MAPCLKMSTNIENKAQPSLSGHVAFVAASSQGIGKAVALELRARGADIVISSRSDVNLQKTESDLKGIPGHGRICRCVVDLEAEASVTSGIEFTIKEFGKIDILIGNSGGFGHRHILGCTTSDWEAAITNKFRSLLWLTQAALPTMQSKGSGVIVNIGSAYSKEPHNGYLLTNSVRLLASAFLKSLADECAPHGIRVNQVLCGYVATDRVKAHFSDIAKLKKISEPLAMKEALEKIPLRRFADPSEIAKAVAFLVGSEASYITGHSLVCDGGLIRTAQ